MKNAFSVLDQLGAILPTLGGFLVLPQSHVVQRPADGVARAVIAVALDTAADFAGQKCYGPPDSIRPGSADGFCFVSIIFLIAFIWLYFIKR